MSGSTSRRLGGVVQFSINGDAWDVVELEYSASSANRETMGGLSRIEGYSETPKAPYIQVTLRDRADEDLNGYFNVAGQNFTIFALLANGKQLQGDGMWVTDLTQARAREATFDVRFEGDENSLTEVTV